MLLRQILQFLVDAQINPDPSPAERDRFYGGDDLLEMVVNAQAQDIPIYVSGGGDIYLCSLIVPIEELEGDYVTRLLNWSFQHSSGYGYGYQFNDGSPIQLFFEAEGFGPGLERARPLIFLRHFAGYTPPSYVELDQRMSHVLDLHWVAQKEAWCQWGELAEAVPVVKQHRDEKRRICTISRDALDFLLFLHNSSLVQFIDITRYEDLIWLTGDGPEEIFSNHELEIYAKRHIARDADGLAKGSWLRAFHVVRCSRTDNEMRLRLTDDAPREYASFLIHDWKHRRNIEWSSHPDKIGNYFVESDLPFGTSPAYFKPDVLLHFRQDPERFTVGERNIEARGAWSLRYGVNDEGQVFAYLCDLRHLPYEEQLRWKAFNEPPKAGLPDHVIQTDIHGRWHDHPDPIRTLKRLLSKFPNAGEDGRLAPVWLIPKSSPSRDLDALDHVRTDSRKEWEDQVLTLAQLLVEGLNAKHIKQLAEAYSCRNKELGSLKQLAEVLKALNLEEDIAVIIDPIGEAWHLRSRVVAHAGGGVPSGDLKLHFDNLAERCAGAMERLAELVDSGTLSMPKTDSEK